jgi:spermidine synthase
LVTQGLNGGFRLVTNGHSMSGTGKWGQRYMRLFVHLPLLARPESSRVLVICFGVGNTAHAASLHPSVERLEVVDLSIDILRAAPHFVQGNRGVLQDPRVAVFVNDGRQHLRMSPPDSFDLITAEPPPLTNAGAAALYSTEFYRLIESRLKPGGWVTQWLPIYQVTGDVARSLVHTFAEVFPGAAVFSGAGNELILAGVRGGPVRLDPAVLASSLQDREAVAEDLRFVWVGSIEDLLATLVAAPSTISRATGGATTLTDDLPFMEYRSTLFAPRKRLPDELFDPTRLSEICPACFVEGGLPLDLQGLAHRQQILAAIYGSDVFLEPAPPADPALREARRPFVLPTSSAAIALLESTPYLRIMKRMYWRGGGER